jgi:GTP cyclohydrolase IA
MQVSPLAVNFEQTKMKAGRALKKAPESVTSLTNDRIVSDATLADLYHEVLLRIGEDPERDGLKRTPERMEKAIQFLTRGYNENPTKLLRDALFDVDYDEMVIVKDVEMFSLCEHHMLPFFGKVHVAYLPKGKVIGLSKIPRLIDVFARRLQVQERLTKEIADSIQDAIDPLGVGVVIEARHLCMMMRGVEKQHSATVTSAMLGAFRDDQQTRSEFLSLIGSSKPNGF